MNTASLSFIVSNDFYALLSEASSHYNFLAGYKVADKFLSAVEEALTRIEANPYCGSRYHAPSDFSALAGVHYRQMNLGNASPFPYIIYYEITSQHIVVRTIYHHSRHRDRLLLS